MSDLTPEELRSLHTPIAPDGHVLIQIHPADVPALDHSDVQDMAFEHAVATWHGDSEYGFVDHLETFRELYSQAQERSLFWSSQAIHMAAALITTSGLAMPVAGSTPAEHQASTRRRMLAMAEGLRAGLLATWVTATVLSDRVPTDSSLVAEGLGDLDSVRFAVAFRD
jgi:hypothetical protein